MLLVTSYYVLCTFLCLLILLHILLQLCLMIRDTDAEIRVAAFNALGKIRTVSEDILLQTLSKKTLAATKEKKYPGQYTAKLFNIPATAAAFTFVHGLEDEFYQVTSYCFNHSIWWHLFQRGFHVTFYASFLVYGWVHGWKCHLSNRVSCLLSLDHSLAIPFH